MVEITDYCDHAASTKPSARPPLSRRISAWMWARSTGVGVTLSLLAALALSLNGLFGKLLLGNKLTTSWFLFLSRQACMAVYILPLTTSHKLIDKPTCTSRWVSFSGRCIAGNVSVMLYYTALQLAPLAEVGVIFTSTAPIFSSILSCIVFRERFRVTDLVFMLLSATGVLLILRPSAIFPAELTVTTSEESFNDRLLGAACALGAALGQAITIMCMRYLSTDIHYSVIIFWYGLSGAVGIIPIIFALDAFQYPPSYISRAGIIALGVFSTVGQIFLTMATRYVTPPIVSLTRSSELAFLFLWQLAFLKGQIHVLSLVGSAVVMLAMILLFLRSYIIDALTRVRRARSEAGELGATVREPINDKPIVKFALLLTK